MNLFGTDGIRGTYGITLTDGSAFLLGKSLALLGGDCPIVLVCRDTRPSGEKLFNALAQGVYEGGGNVINLGILPTNAVGHFVRKMGGDYGVMITASHNPPQDNGLKVFDRYGVKLCRSKQETVSKLMQELAPAQNYSHVFEPVFYDIENIYCEDMLKSLEVRLKGLQVALDCCYGAAYRVARKIFAKAGANVTCFADKKLGKQINQDCGATCPQFLAQNLQSGNFDLGFAFDGDCDRLAVFEGTTQVPNNKVFFAIAKYLAERGALRNNAVCGTVLTNGGVEAALKQIGVGLVRSDVGDVNVFDAMVKNGLNFGGEESGHYLLCDFTTGSDALVNALFVAKIFCECGSILQYAQSCEEIACASANLPLTEQNQSLASSLSLQNISKRIAMLFPHCRLVLRKSGTENKVRAYAEGQQCQQAIDCVVATFSQKIVLP